MRKTLVPLALLALPALESHASAQNCFQAVRTLPGQILHLGHFGETVALSSDWAVIGDWAAWSFQWSPNGVGALNLYRRDPVNGELAFHEQLRPADHSGSDWFGWDLDLHGSTLAVGAPGNALPPNNQVGAVYLYEWNGQDWAFSEKVRAPAGAATHRFGVGVDVTDDWLAVRVPLAPELFVYRRTPTGAVHQATIQLDQFLVDGTYSQGAAGVRIVGDHILASGLFGVRVYAFDAALQTWNQVIERDLSNTSLGAAELGEEGLFFANRNGLRFVPRDPVTGAWGAEELISDGDYYDSLAYADGQLGVYGADPASFPFTAYAVRAFRRGPLGWRLKGNTRYYDYTTGRCMATDGRSFLVGGLEGGLITFECGNLGFHECVQAPGNSTGMAGDLGAYGSLSVGDNDLELVASHLPLGQFGVFASSRNLSAGSTPAGSDGDLCVTGGMGLFNGPGQVQRVDSSGELRLQLDLATLPVSGGFASALPGDTWYFQGWYRDRPMAPTSRFTSALSVTFE